MSIPVSLAALRGALEQHGSVAHLVTVGVDGAPHVVSVELAWDEGVLVCSAGRSTCANAAERPAVTLVWPPAAEPGYSLLVDATAAAGDGRVRLAPTSAVLHRQAGEPDAGPTCKPVE